MNQRGKYAAKGTAALQKVRKYAAEGTILRCKRYAYYPKAS